MSRKMKIEAFALKRKHALFYFAGDGFYVKNIPLHPQKTRPGTASMRRIFAIPI